MTSNTLQEILDYKKMILTGCKIISIFIYIYLLSRANQYQVEWNLFRTLFPSAVGQIDTWISVVGVYILSIPLTIIFLSLLISESFKLHVMASCFGLFSIIISLVLNAMRVGESYNLKILMVTKLLTLQEKIEIFTEQFTKIMKKKFLNDVPFEYTTEEFLRQFYSGLEETSRNTADKIRLYAYECTEPYLPKTNLGTSLQNIDVMTALKVIVVVAGISFVGYIMLTNTGLIDIVKGFLGTAQKGQELMTNTLENTQNLATNVSNIAITQANVIDNITDVSNQNLQNIQSIADMRVFLQIQTLINRFLCQKMDISPDELKEGVRQLLDHTHDSAL